jgi:hypothetical protein
MLGVYLTSGGILVVLAVLAFVVLPGASGNNQSQIMALAGIAYIIVAAAVLGFVFIANIIYWGNHWVVTDDSITQVSQTGLFSKQSAQLSLGNLEDVTSEQNGLLAQLFKFGTLKAETAGERSKFMFPFCPKPNYYAQKILAAREIFERDHHGGKQVPYVAPITNPLNVPVPAPAPEQPAPPQQDQYQIGQTPPNFGMPSQAPPLPGQPPAGTPSQQDSPDSSQNPLPPNNNPDPYS